MAEIKKLGRYEVKGVLGKGAMGLVYDGRDPQLDRRVAIKTIITKQPRRGDREALRHALQARGARRREG